MRKAIEKSEDGKWVSIEFRKVLNTDLEEAFLVKIDNKEYCCNSYQDFKRFLAAQIKRDEEA